MVNFGDNFIVQLFKSSNDSCIIMQYEFYIKELNIYYIIYEFVSRGNDKTTWILYKHANESSRRNL